MGYRGSDRGYGDDRWRDRDDGGRSYGSRGTGRDFGHDDDRGFIDRAGDEVRSWFGDEEAVRRREADERRWEREREISGRRGNESGESAGSGWGNQRGESWHRDRPGERSFGGDEWRGGGRDEAFGGDRHPGGTSGLGAPDHGRRFDRSSAARSGERGGLHDPHYSEWRSRQIDDFDRDYDEFRREHQSKFEQEFADWRTKRQGQRQLLGRVTEHMGVTGSDGEQVGTVDKVRGDRIILTKGEDSGGVHHSIPCSWVESVEDKVVLNRAAREAKEGWRKEESSSALFDRGEQSGEGPHMLNRSFSGTYGRD